VEREQFVGGNWWLLQAEVDYRIDDLRKRLGVSFGWTEPTWYTERTKLETVYEFIQGQRAEVVSYDLDQATDDDKRQAWLASVIELRKPTDSTPVRSDRTPEASTIRTATAPLSRPAFGSSSRAAPIESERNPEVGATATSGAPPRRSPFGTRVLGDADKAALIEYAVSLRGGPLNPEWTKQVDGYAKFYTKLPEAKQALLQWTQGPGRFDNVKPVEQTWANSLKEWLDDPAQPLLKCVATAGMTGQITTTAGATKYILATQSIMGCLGVAACGNGAAFLAHWTPDQLKPEALQGRLADIANVVGATAAIHLSSPAMTQGATYVVNFKAAMRNTAFQPGNEYSSQRLAINAKTGATLIDFSVDGLLPD
jgi:hypothetical protein